MVGTAHRRWHVGPAHGESHLGQLQGEQVANATHAGEVLAATRDVHGLLQERDIVVVMYPNVVADARFGFRQGHKRPWCGDHGGCGRSAWNRSTGTVTTSENSSSVVATVIGWIRIGRKRKGRTSEPKCAAGERTPPIASRRAAGR
jgi:hypothetical protein